jgi:hypothetical protein
MKTFLLITLAGGLLLPLAACSQADNDHRAAPASASTTAAAGDDEKTALREKISGEIQHAMDEAKHELETRNIEVGRLHFGGHGHGVAVADDDDHPRTTAEITPQGDFLVAGKPVATTPDQRTLLLGYRQQIIGIAEAGMDIGTHAADLGMSAAKEAIWGAFTGKSDKDIEAAIKPQTDRIQAAAAGLCRRLPDLLVAQQKLAVSLPAFKPYATMTQKDVEDCGKNTETADRHQHEEKE